MTLSACLIVKDEQQVIARCLGCVKKFADEIVVVDTGSSDDTVALARNFTDKIYSFAWRDDFSAARNFSLEKATGDYIIWLDADDVVADADCALIKKTAEQGGFDLAYLPYATAFDGDTPTFVYNRERIFRRTANFRFEGVVHEAVTPHGKTISLDAVIQHRKVKPGDRFRNLGIYQRQIARGISLDERSVFYYARELMFNGMYREAAAVFESFLSGNGWIENRIEACFNLYDCYKKLGDGDAAMKSLTKSFVYSAPRPRACCILGEHFASHGDTASAIRWYTLALSADTGRSSGAFVNSDYSKFIPCLQLCVLYDALGDCKTANAYNEQAGKVKPYSAEYLYNKKYFSDKLPKEV